MTPEPISIPNDLLYKILRDQKEEFEYYRRIKQTYINEVKRKLEEELK